VQCNARALEMVTKLDISVLLGLAGCAGALACVAPLPAAVATGIALVVFARGGRKRRWRLPHRGRRFAIGIAGAAMFLVCAWRAGAVVRAYEASRTSLLDGRWPAQCGVSGTIARSPVRMGDALRVDVDVARSTCASAMRIAISVPVNGAPVLARGDRIEAQARLAPLYMFWNDGDPRPARARRQVLLSGGADDVVIVERGRGIGALIDRARERVRRRIVATFPPDTSGMARALVLGEDDLSTEDQRAFRRSGLAHLLAVSGMHLVIVVFGAVAAIRAVLVRLPAVASRGDPMRIAAAIGIPLAWIYADFAGASGSALRAAWMASVALLAHALGRHRAPWRALGLSMIAMLAFDPLAAFDLSFLLSAASTLGILALVPPIEARLHRLPRFIATPIAASAAASVACAPILATMAGDLPLVGLFANVVAVPLGEAAALPICILHALLAPLPLAERGCAAAASGALMAVRAIARGAASIPWGAVPIPPPSPWQLAAIAVGVFGAAQARHRRAWAIGALVVVIALEVRARPPHGVLRATFVDVGQGDAALVDLPDGSAMLVDGGGLVGSSIDVGERAIAPLLRARRRREIAVVVLSHPHPDHFAGLLRGLDGVRVGELWDTGQGEIEGTGGAYAELLARMRAKGTRIVRPHALCGTRAVGGAIVDIVAPCPGPSSDHGPNDNSLVLRIRYGTRAFLFAGDAERYEESQLDPSKLRADVLKVGHHGSKTSSTPEFLAAVSPRVAVISCGIKNRFGHPHRSTLVSLSAVVPSILRTDRDGAVGVTTDGSSLDIWRSAP
jgi:competence protein ComEC